MDIKSRLQRLALAGQAAYSAGTKGQPLETILKEQDGLRPAPYLASRGFKWIQHYAAPGLNDDDLKDYIIRSHKLVASGLSKKKQKELGLL